MLSDFDQRMLDLSNQLHDMTYAEWKRIRLLIDKKFEAKKKELEQQLQLSVVNESDL